MKYILRVFLLFCLAFFFSHLTYAQTVIPNSETPSQREARLRAELAQVEQEQKDTEKILAEAQQQSSSLKRDILILDTKIKAAELNIKAKNLIIQGLGKDITKKERTIETLVERIDRGRASLADILRKTNEVGSITIPEIILSEQNISQIFSDLDTFQSVRESLKTTFEEIRNTKSQTETEKNKLDKRRNQEVDARQVIVFEQKNIAINQAEKQRLLTVSKGNEKIYSTVLVEKIQKAAQIRAALFSLRDAQAIPFGDALKFATTASRVTGVRPAFILAILTQESALGANVGSCYLTNKDTGSGVSTKTGSVVSNVMKPGRDVEPFITITNSLGLDPMRTLVSCPQSVGWGGAMGPSQFIASTWMLFKNRISSALGTSLPNPWNPQDAFMAASIYLGDLGAIGGSYTGEQNAACKYYSGKSCGASTLVRSYGNSVMSHADTIQRNMIDPLQGV